MWAKQHRDKEVELQGGLPPDGVFFSVRKVKGFNGGERLLLREREQLDKVYPEKSWAFESIDELMEALQERVEIELGEAL